MAENRHCLRKRVRSSFGRLEPHDRVLLENSYRRRRAVGIEELRPFRFRSTKITLPLSETHFRFHHRGTDYAVVVMVKPQGVAQLMKQDGFEINLGVIRVGLKGCFRIEKNVSVRD